MSQEGENNFWISYSDLATGLMIVFMLVMLVMVILEKKQGEIQTDRISKVVQKIEIILGQKSKLGDSLNKAFVNDNSIVADPVTAQLSVQDDLLHFSENRAFLQPKGKEFLDWFTPNYICALWKHETDKCESRQGQCNRLNPERPGAIRRIMVTGHADMFGNFDHNLHLSTARAKAVVDQMLKVLQCAINGEDCTAKITVPENCKAKELLSYAEERLWAVGAGETQHCTSQLNTLKNQSMPCDSVVDNQVDPSQRKVDFVLELTGDDMTGLLADLVALRNAVGDDRNNDALDKLATQVASTCWEDPTAYHGCDNFALECLKDDLVKVECKALFDKANSDTTTKEWLMDICNEHKRSECSDMF